MDFSKTKERLKKQTEMVKAKANANKMGNMNNEERNANNETRNAPQKTERKIRDYCFSGTDGYGSCIGGQRIEAESFEINLQFISLLNNQAHFLGFSHEDHNQHIVEFVDVVGLMKIKGMSSKNI